MSLSKDSLLVISATHRLQWEKAQQINVILYPEGIVELSQSSAEILKLCDGTRNFKKIVADLEQKFATTGLKQDINKFLETAQENGWIKQL